MPYATQDGMTDRFGEQELIQLTDKTGEGAIDADVLARAMSDADAEVDSYLGSRYSLPLSVAPAIVDRIACDVARYRLFGVKAPEEVRTRYEDARSWLRDVAKGKVAIAGLAPDSAPAHAATVSAPEPVFGSALFGRMPGGLP